MLLSAILDALISKAVVAPVPRKANKSE
jgi:hypothetical protein